MKTMIILMVFVCCVCVLGVPPVFAQEETFQPGQLLADLKARLELTQDQIAQLRPIMQKQSEQLKSVLNSEQLQKLKTYQEELHEKIRQKFFERRKN